MFAGSFAPVGWFLCDGQLRAVSEYQELFSLLGDMYGGDGLSTFGVPDLRGRAAVHAGQRPGHRNYIQGRKNGTEWTTLTAAQLPAHGHAISVEVKAVANPGNQGSPVGHAWAEDGVGAAYTYSDATPDQDMKAGSVVVTEHDAGGSQPHTNQPPYQVVNYIIAWRGLYPRRS
jgi:microcystin-dependent protein